MAIIAPPGNMGSSALAETGKNWMGEARVAVRLPFSGWMSEMGNRSQEAYYTIDNNQGFNKDELINWMRSIGTTPAVITIKGTVISYAWNAPTLEFPADLQNSTVKLLVQGDLLGRGGNGGTNGNGSSGRPGGAGGHAVNNLIGGRLQIDNAGRISGGGGGGASGWCFRIDQGGRPAPAGYHGGGGGAPYGTGGAGVGLGGRGGDGSLTGGGGQGHSNGLGAGAPGGGWGANGGTIQNQAAGGAAGWAIASQGPTWINRGNIIGPSM